MAANLTRGARKDQSSVTLVIDGVDTGDWETLSGGEVDSDDTMVYPGARKAPVSLGGKQIPGARTLVRTFDLDRDLPMIKRWMNRAGKARCIVKDQAFDEDDNAFGSPIVQTGKLKTVTPPERDSSDSAAAQVTVVVSIDGAVA